MADNKQPPPQPTQPTQRERVALGLTPHGDYVRVRCNDGITLRIEANTLRAALNKR